MRANPSGAPRTRRRQRENMAPEVGMIYFPSPDLALEKGNENDSTGERTVESSGIRHHTEPFSLGPSGVYPEDSVFKPAFIVFFLNLL